MAPLIKYDLSPRDFHLGKSYALLNRSVGPFNSVS